MDVSKFNASLIIRYFHCILASPFYKQWCDDHPSAIIFMNRKQYGSRTAATFMGLAHLAGRPGAEPSDARARFILTTALCDDGSSYFPLLTS